MMENITKIITDEMKLPSTQPYSEEEYLKSRCDSYNSTTGNLNEKDGFNCEFCRNKGHYMLTVDGELRSRPCPKCSNIRKSIHFLRKSGLSKCTFESFKTENEWQRNLLQTVRNYSANFVDKWLFIGGQSGSGKTHLCTAVLQELVFNHRKEILLFEWAEKSKKLKQLINDPKYDEELSRYKSVSVLYIDDLFKVKRGETATAADVNLAFELLDYRDRENLTTIISSEFSIDDIISIDEATGGRIKYRAQEYALHIGKDRGKNYRLK